jgi:hypothetical protein
MKHCNEDQRLMHKTVIKEAFVLPQTSAGCIDYRFIIYMWYTYLLVVKALLVLATRLNFFFTFCLIGF